MKHISFKVLPQTYVLLASLLLAGCAGGGGGASPDGSLANPWVLPAEYDAVAVKKIKDYVADGGYLQFNYDHLNVNTTGSPVSFGGSLVYDTVNDTWTVAVNGVDYTLTDDGAFNYASGTCGTEFCAELDMFDVQDAFTYGVLAGRFLGGAYGSFGTLTTESTTGDVDIAYLYTGMKTPDMPTAGTANYTAVFEGGSTAVNGSILDVATATMSMSADFGTGDFVFSSAGDVVDGGGATVATYTLDSAATISGNTYSGTATGSLTVSSVTDSTYTGTIEGAFYGPSAVETAGVIMTENSTGDTLGGGFWGEDPTK